MGQPRPFSPDKAYATAGSDNDSGNGDDGDGNDGLDGEDNTGRDDK
ncbi:hypothetical protein J22TS3_09930 [Paenibacillus sp. J22TS3]|nr:hypothetical protein J22TS3_09930 [Paenibacillus sp. J22TS3]